MGGVTYLEQLILAESGGVQIYRRLSTLQKDWAELNQLGYKKSGIDCSSWRDLVDAHKGIAASLGEVTVPGQPLNMDELHSYLWGYSFEDTGEMVIQMTNFDVFWKLDQHRAFSMLDMFSSISRFHLLNGARFALLVQTNELPLNMAPIGCVKLYWSIDDFRQSGAVE